MPRFWGRSGGASESLKADPAVTRVIPCIHAWASSSEERDVVESYDLGVNSYLVKPVDFAAFSAVVAQAGLYWAVMNRIPR